MTTVYPNETRGRVLHNPGRTDVITGVYDDLRAGGFVSIYRVDGKAGDTIDPADGYTKLNQGKERGFKHPSQSVVLVSGERRIDELDDADQVIGTELMNTENRFSGYGRTQVAFRGKSTYIEDTTSYCIMVSDRDYTSQQNGATFAGNAIPMTGGPNAIYVLWSSSASFGGQTYAAPSVFYGTAPPGDRPQAVTDCAWVRLIAPQRTGAR